MSFVVGDALKLTGQIPQWVNNASHVSKAPPFIPSLITITAVRPTGYQFRYTQITGATLPPPYTGTQNSFGSEDCNDPYLTSWSLA